jgi:leucyl-tRNA synthetase
MESEARWQQEWQKEKLFEANPEKKRKKFFLTAAFPYPNSPQHVGHGRTYTTTDIYARYKRMTGHNVLFPMGLHVTGTPIIAMARRLKEQDDELLGIFEKIYGIPREKALSLAEPVPLVTYFSQEIEAGMKEMGYSIDWRRKFYSYDAHFNKFIQWQFAKLKEQGLILQGEHPVPWCPKDKNPVGAHDTKGDVDPQIEEVTVIKFEADGGNLICSTYRPETLFGVTNIWVNPKAEYVIAKKGSEKYYLAKEAAKTIAEQLGMKVEKEVAASELLKMMAKNPLTGKLVPVFPASFVDAATGTGIVMSVPAHAPYDYLALRDAGLDKQIELVQVLSLVGFGQFPAKEIVEQMKITSQNDPKAEEATSAIYKKEAHTGVMAIGKYKGKKGVEAKEAIGNDLVAEGKAMKLYELSNGPVYCRCGAQCTVNMVKNQWFIDYGDAKWKAKVKECLAEMRILPEKTVQDYYYTVDWLKEKACTRASGLGTRFPFDEKQMIEALSDSTIYMAFYTISHLLKKEDAGKLDGAFFDYVFLGKGDAKATAEMKKLREEFLYWYPLDSRHSATDLIHNHLVFLIFIHTAIFEKKHWPRQIITNGFVLMDGSKMSKSFGNILPIRQAITQYGADVVRFSVVAGADLASDSDFNRTVAEGIMGRLKGLRALVEQASKEGKKTRLEFADKWLLSRLHGRVKRAKELFETLELRPLCQQLLFESFSDLQWYLKRTDKPALREFFEYWCLLIAPIMPHVAEEFWETLGKKKFVKDSKLAAGAAFPAADEKKIDAALERGEEFVQATRDDISAILKLLKKEGQAKKISLYVADEWKGKLRAIVVEKRDFGTAMKAAMADSEMKAHGQQAKKAIENLMKNIGGLKVEALSATQELVALDNSAAYLSKEFGCPIVVLPENKAPAVHAQKATNAMPGKASIFIE